MMPGSTKAAPRLVLLTYATPEFEAARAALEQSAWRAGFNRVISLGPRDFLQTTFADAHRSITSASRGAGYWLWKPYYLRQIVPTLESNEVLVYCDAGRQSYYRVDPAPVALAAKAQASAQGFVIGPAIPQHGPMRCWTKRDCAILTGIDGTNILDRPPLQATWSIWTNRPAAIAFLDKWLKASCDPRALTDGANELGLPDYPEFRDHRHDQAILSAIAYREAVAFIDFSPTWLFGAMRLRPNAQMTHLFLKSPRNVERLVRGWPAIILFFGELIAQRFRAYHQTNDHNYD